MLNIDIWVNELLLKIKNIFNDNLLFLGYQGSYRRGEATDKSDIDIVVVLDKLEIKDLSNYKKLIASMPESKKACGFICSKDELKNWSKFEIFQLYNDTKPVYGDLKNFIPEISLEDAKIAAKIGAQNLYHLACHSYLYGTDLKEALKALYKNAVFVIQAQYFVQNNEYILTKRELSERLFGIEKDILKIAVNKDFIDDFSKEQVENCYKMVIDYSSEIIKKYH